MQVDVQKTQEQKCIVNISIPASEVEKESLDIVNTIRPKVSVSGFRKGSAPNALIKNLYRKYIAQQVSERLVYKGTGEALRQAKLKNISNPELLEEFRVDEKKKKDHLGLFSLDGSFKFAISVELPPEIDVINYKGVEVYGDNDTFDFWFNSKLRSERFVHGVKTMSSEPISFGDEALADFEAEEDGQPYEEGSLYNFSLSIGSGMMSLDLEKAFLEKCAGEKIEAEVSFPQDYADDRYAGKSIKFKCLIHEVYRSTPHEYNDEFAQLLGYSDTKDLEESWKTMWSEEFEEAAKVKIFDKVMQKVSEANPFDVPQAWIDAEIKNRVRTIDINSLDENSLASLRDICEKSVRYAFLLDCIYEKETELHILPEEFKEMAAREALNHNMDAFQLIEKMKQMGTYEGFVAYNEQRKTMNFLIDNAVVLERRR